MCSLRLIEKRIYRKLNHLTTDDAFWHLQFLAACYQLAHSVLKISFALAKRVEQGEVGAYTGLVKAG